jgi:sRNA-binding protein
MPMVVSDDQDSFGLDSEAIAEMVQAHVAAELGALDVDANVAEFVRRETERALRRAEKAQAKAERAVERATKRARARARRAEERAQRRMKRQEEQANKRRRGARREKWTTSRPTAEPVTEEERLAVLKMLEVGKITIEEANTLLEALEG